MLKFVVMGRAHTDYSTKMAGEINNSVRANGPSHNKTSPSTSLLMIGRKNGNTLNNS